METKHILMPDLGESVTEATVVEWFKQVGDTVNKYDPLLEAQSDKVVTEIPSEFNGTIVEFLVEEGATVPIGTPLLAMEVGAGEKVAATEVEEAPAAPKEALQEAFEPEAEMDETVESVAEKPNQKPTPPREITPRFSPAVMRLAQERNIDLNEVEGTGRHGRITRKDVENFEPITNEKAVSRAEEKTTTATEKGAAAKETSPTQEVVRADGVRRMIAENVTRSAQEIPHAWMLVEADVTNIVRLREQVKETFLKEEGVPITYFTFFVKAVAQALKKHPLLNASWDDGQIIYHKEINLSIAVATDEHLYVPVIQQADQYSIKGLAQEIQRLADGARNQTLGADAMKGGTFTVNNTGSFGSAQSMGIINHPQVAILQVETISKKILPTEEGFKVADMVNLSLSIDHRLIDGLQAGRFLQEVKANLAQFEKESQLY